MAPSQAFHLGARDLSVLLMNLLFTGQLVLSISSFKDPFPHTLQFTSSVSELSSFPHIYFFFPFPKVKQPHKIPSAAAQQMGITLSSDLSFQSHISCVVNTCQFHLLSTFEICAREMTETTKALVHVLVLSWNV